MKVDNNQLKEFLIDAELIDQKTLEQKSKEAQAKKKKLGDYLVEKGIVPEDRMRKLYAYILGIPFVDLEKEVIDKEILQLIPEGIARKNNIVAFKKNKNELRVAMLDPENIQIIDFIKKKTGLKIYPCFTSKTSMEAVLKQYKKSLQAEFGDIIKKNAREVSAGEDLEKVAQDLPIIKIVDTLLKHAIFQSASDIHIEPDEKEVRVRYRIDGILHDAMILPSQILSGIVARIKVLSNLKLDEHRIPQDGRFKIEEDGKKISFRVSTIPVFRGEKIVMRILDESTKGLTLEKMGLWGDSLEIIHRSIKKPNGMILVTGPTGSGKTTTLYTILDILNTPEVNIATIEDPIEYQMPRINQTQVNPKVGMTFAIGLRALLRQDPDIIMVGEIRDKETIQIALNASMTGHLVLSTLHTNSAAAAIPRMVDMQAEKFLIASTVSVIIAQRLVRKICPDCRKEYKLSKEQLDDFKKNVNLEELDKIIEKSDLPGIKNIKKVEDVSFYKGTGCDRCGGEGYRGRVGIYEVLEVTEAIQKVILANSTADEIEKVAKSEGMHNMMTDGIIKAIQGITTIEEVMRVTKE
ncbi:MAG: ATPase, T2SS/T4P/T4SS family [Candidatus Moranbacteria bacterium]|jgi:type IV pilus assembly protein PilB|nr:ATPase, T2SS/T4P/T4SS family [Candidatus Moranbacteria bacterium]